MGRSSKVSVRRLLISLTLFVLSVALIFQKDQGNVHRYEGGRPTLWRGGDPSGYRSGDALHIQRDDRMAIIVHPQLKRPHKSSDEATLGNCLSCKPQALWVARQELHAVLRPVPTRQYIHRADQPRFYRVGRRQQEFQVRWAGQIGHLVLGDQQGPGSP